MAMKLALCGRPSVGRPYDPTAFFPPNVFQRTMIHAVLRLEPTVRRFERADGRRVRGWLSAVPLHALPLHAAEVVEWEQDPFSDPNGMRQAWTTHRCGRLYNRDVRHSCFGSGLQHSEEPEDQKASQSYPDSREKAQYDQTWTVYGENGIDSSYHVHGKAEMHCETRIRSPTLLLVSYGAVAAARSDLRAPAYVPMVDCRSESNLVSQHRASPAQQMSTKKYLEVAIVDRIPSDGTKQDGASRPTRTLTSYLFKHGIANGHAAVAQRVTLGYGDKPRRFRFKLDDPGNLMFSYEQL
ncbi:hypothetical protein EDD15DRAFT_2204188 [Pisolithus albus]|nr:hypothetical protein EDD15DRAFT_2204188 [Pisolithus albus]